MNKREFVTLLGGAAAAWPLMAHAQTYPSRPITIVVPAPPGGPGDTIARVLAEPMRALLGQPVIIENVGGANGTIGTARVARGKADINHDRIAERDVGLVHGVKLSSS